MRSSTMVSKQLLTLKNIFLQLDEGSTIVRILPAKDSDAKFFAETKIHRLPNEHGGTKNYQCRRVHGEDCPLCDLYYDLWDKHNEWCKDRDLDSRSTKTPFSEGARKIKPAARYYMNVFDRASESVVVLSAGKMLFEGILQPFFDEDYGPNFIDPIEGHDYKIEKVMEDGWPRYHKSQPRPKPSRLGPDAQIAAVMDQLHDIQGMVRLEEFEDVRDAADNYMSGITVENSEKSAEEGEAFDVNKLRS